MGDTPDAGIAALRTRISELLAAALRSDEALHDEMQAARAAHERHADRLQHAIEAAQERHEREAAAGQHAHDDEMRAAVAAHEHQVEGLEQALATRDLIGQAKGIIMAAMHCSPDVAFGLLVKQSQAENRKLVDIAADITASIRRRPRLRPAAGGGSPPSAPVE